MNVKQKALVIIFSIFFLLIIPTNIAVANSAPAPLEFWFKIEPEKEVSSKITSAQLIGCKDSKCAQPVLLASFKSCSSELCLPSEELNTAGWQFECTKNICVAITPYYLYQNSGQSFMKLNVEIQDQFFTTTTIPFPECVSCSNYWGIDITSKPASVTPLTEDPVKQSPPEYYLKLFALSTLTEILIGLGIGLLWKRKAALSIHKLLDTILLANVFTYPMVWLAIPALGEFKFDYARKSALVFAVTFTIVTIYCLWAWKKRLLSSNLIAIVSPIFAVFTIVFFFIAEFISVFDNSGFHITGLPYFLVIIIAELLAVFYETFMIYTLRKDEITFKQALLLCTLTNIGSLLISFII